MRLDFGVAVVQATTALCARTIDCAELAFVVSPSASASRLPQDHGLRNAGVIEHNNADTTGACTILEAL